MSTLGVRSRPNRDRDGRILRGAILAGALAVVASFLSAMYFVVDVVGNPMELLAVVGAALVVATVASRFVPVRQAVGLSGGLMAVGMVWYLFTLPANTFAFGGHIEYIVALLSGTSILSIVNLEQWVLAVTPAPVFLTWYLALRGRYGASALVGGATVGFFVLTGDATFPVALVGIVGVLALVGLGELERAGASLVQVEVVSIVLTVIIITSLTVSLVPQGAAMQYSPSTGFTFAGESGGDTLEANLLSDTNSLDIKGSISLSPKVRWTVESPSSDYWRVGTFDLYTGDGWVRSGDGQGELGAPPGESRRVEQTYTAETDMATMPAAWRPTAVEGQAADAATVSGFGSLVPSRTLSAGESYTVTSQVPVATGNRLQSAGTQYPERIEEQYTQLPDSTPDRVAEKTRILTDNAETPYETALTIERWLENNREYSLEVPEPGNNVADEFLFEREAGYCVYFASTMAVMLRSQNIPARMVVGYSTGERVAEDEWVVRGYNSHAWVEAYFPSVGWVRFDPTPGGPRDTARGQTLQEARADNESNIDTEETLNPDYQAPDVATGDGPNRSVPVLNGSTRNVTNRTETPSAPDTSGASQAPSAQGSGGDGEGGNGVLNFSAPSREEVFLGFVAMFGIAAAVRRSGASRRVYQEIRLRWQRSEDPDTDVERAYRRLETLLAEAHRRREPGETTRQYLDAIDADERAREVARIRERARYAGTVEQADAERAIELVDELVAQR